MEQQQTWRAALARADAFATEAVSLTRGAPRRSYAELSQRIDDAEIVLELLERADTFASLALVASEEDDAIERAETAEALAREAWREAVRRTGNELTLDTDAA